MYPGRFSTNQHPDFEILGEISRGGMGVVVKANQRGAQRLCALKLISIQTDHPDQHRLLKRLEREAQALSRVRHHNIVTLYSYAYEDNVPFMVMELIEGENLESLFENRPQGFETHWLCDSFLQIAEALSFCHDKGVIHRDVKPSNLIFTPNSDGSTRPVLVDFGITKVAEQAVSQSNQGLSLTGELVGTPAYMSPEQLDPDKFGEVSPKTDVWGFGVSLYQCLTGVLPFAGSNTVETLQKIYFDSPPAPSKLNGDTPTWLNTLVLKCLEKHPSDRPDMTEVVTALKERETQGSPKLKLFAAIFIVLTLSIATVTAMELLKSPTKNVITVLQFTDPPNFTKTRAIVIEAQISMANAPIRVGKVTGYADDNGHISLKLPLLDGTHSLSLQALNGEEWIDLKTFTIRVDTQKPLIHFSADFGNVCLVQKRQSVSIRIRDESPVEWSEGKKWTAVNSSNTIKLFADPSQPRRTLKVRDAAGHESQVDLTLIERDQWSRIQSTIDNWRDWQQLPANQKRILTEWLTSRLGDAFQFKGIRNFGESKRPFPIAIFLHKTTGMLFHLIPGGRYKMGSTLEEVKANLRFGFDYALKLSLNKLKKAKSKELPKILLAEMPLHSVNVKAFLLAEHECTRKEWAKLNRPNFDVQRNPDIPKANVSWEEIKSTLKSSGTPFRLPSEAEWEYACRATTTTRFYWGDDSSMTQAWCFNNSGKVRHTYLEHIDQRNRFGLIDMTGNVGEWCEDSAIPNYDDGPTTEAPRVDPKSRRKVVRGGSFKQGLGIGRSSRRSDKAQDTKSVFIGLRLSISIPKDK